MALADDTTRTESRRWQQNPDAVKESILEAASKVFAERGLEGARVDEIAALTQTSKRMIYYYFGDKMGLYGKVLEAAYVRMITFDQRQEASASSPAEALTRLIRFLFDHHRNHPEFIRLLMVENIHNGEFLKTSDVLEQMRGSANLVLERIYLRGVESGMFRPGIDTRALRLMFAGVSFFNVSNRATISLVYGDDLWEEPSQLAFRETLVETMLRYVMTAEASARHFQNLQGEPAAMMDPELRPFLNAWESKWSCFPPNASPQDRRKEFELITTWMRLPTPPEVDASTEHWIETEVSPVRVRVFRHMSGGTQPALIYMHGGAFMQGSPETHWDITARIAAWNRQTVISVDYALAPEHPFPTALTQVSAVVEWTSRHAAELGIDPAQISVGGDSAGGNLAAAVALKLRGGEVKLKAQLLIYPACDFDTSRPSFEENKHGPMITLAGMAAVNSAYCPDSADLVNPLAAPLMAPSHAGLPPAYIAVAHFDPLRDSGTAYAKALTDSGVPVELDPGHGLIHGYLRAMEYCKASRDSLERMCSWLARQND